MTSSAAPGSIPRPTAAPTAGPTSARTSRSSATWSNDFNFSQPPRPPVLLPDQPADRLAVAPRVLHRPPAVPGVHHPAQRFRAGPAAPARGTTRPYSRESRISAADRVLITRPGSIPASSARAQPLASQSSWPGACASVSMANRQPASTARRSSRSGGSWRSGRQLISTATPWSRQARTPPPGSKADSGLPGPRGPAAPGQQAAGAVPEHVHVRAGHRGHHAVGHRPGGHPQVGVDARDDDIELAEQFAVLVERAVLEDVDFDAGQDPGTGPARRSAGR